MDKSVPTGEEVGVGESTKPMATYMPSIGSRAPMFVKSSTVLEYEMYGSGNTSPRASPANPPVTPWDDTGDERDLSPARSPVNMLLATDLTEAMHGRSTGNRSAETASFKAGVRWPYLKQQAARHVYGNLRSRLQRREPVSSPAVCMTYSPGQAFSHQKDGIHIETFGIRPKSDSGPTDEAVSKPRPQLTTDLQPFEKKKNYRISFKSSETEQRSCVSAPPPTAESAVSKPNSSQGSQPAKSASQQTRRSKTAREYYRPKRDPLVRFDSSELPQRFQQDHRPSSVSPKVPTRVTWTDVMTAKSTGVYRDSPDGLGGPRRHNNGSNVRLYLSSELWGILDEDISAIKTVAGKS